MDALSLATIRSRSMIEQGRVNMFKDLKHSNENPDQLLSTVLLPVKLLELSAASASTRHS
jgi:hypothetical protein